MGKPGFVAWMAMNKDALQDCMEVRQTEEGNLTNWIGTFATLRDGKRFMHGNKVATHERAVTTTPAQEVWLS